MSEKGERIVTIIGGCGHIGLPLGLKLAEKGVKVYLLDINKEIVEKINRGEMPFKEKGSDNILKKVLKKKKLIATLDPKVIEHSSVIIVTIGTPVDEHLNPTLKNIFSVLDKYSNYMRDDTVLILRSTLYPGASYKIFKHFKHKRKKIHITYCPERILEGNAIEEIEKLPQIISGFSRKGIDVSKKLFSLITKEIIILKPMEAELLKLFTNAWRYIKFAIVNQFFMIAVENNIDFYNIYNAMKYKYPRTADMPSPGFAAGPCLFKDTMQLSSFYNNNFLLGHTAMLINEGLPNFIINKLKEKYQLSKYTVGILGMAFKAESDDIRDSLSYKLKKNLDLECKKVLCSDPYVKDYSFVSEDYLIKNSDIVIIATPHEIYKKLKYNKKIVIDIWNILGKGFKI